MFYDKILLLKNVQIHRKRDRMMEIKRDAYLQQLIGEKKME